MGCTNDAAPRGRPPGNSAGLRHEGAAVLGRFEPRARVFPSLFAKMKVAEYIVVPTGPLTEGLNARVAVDPLALVRP